MGGPMSVDDEAQFPWFFPEKAFIRNQAFQFGPSAIGLQFHLETTPESPRERVMNCRAERLPSWFGKRC
jgi:GMP synthase-like glutamine amidotransferase